MKSAILMALAILVPMAVQAQGLGEFGLPQEPARTPRATVPAPTTEPAPPRGTRPASPPASLPSEPPRIVPSPAKPVPAADRRTAAFNTVVEMIRAIGSDRASPATSRTAKDGGPGCEPMDGGFVRQIYDDSILANIGQVIAVVDIPTAQKRYTMPGKIAALARNGSVFFSGDSVYDSQNGLRRELKSAWTVDSKNSGGVLSETGDLLVTEGRNFLGSKMGVIVSFNTITGKSDEELSGIQDFSLSRSHVSNSGLLIEAKPYSGKIEFRHFDMSSGRVGSMDFWHNSPSSIDSIEFSGDGSHYYYTWTQDTECSDGTSGCIYRKLSVSEAKRSPGQPTTITLSRGGPTQITLTKYTKYILATSKYDWIDKKTKEYKKEYNMKITDISSGNERYYKEVAYYSLSPDESDVALIKTDCSVEFVKLP